MHLGQLKLCLSSGTCGECHIADDVSKSLSMDSNTVSRASQHSQMPISSRNPFAQMMRAVPFGFMFSKDLPLGMISNDLDIDKASQVELL